MLRKEMGMIFQSAALFDSMTVLDNVMFPLNMFSNDTLRERTKRAMFCLDRVNLGAANDLVDFQWRMLLVALGLGEQPAESGPVAHQIDQLANQAQETVVVETIKDADATEFMSDDDYDF